MATNVLDRVRAEGSRRLADADEQDGQGSGLIKELPDPGPPVELEGTYLGGVRLCAGVAAAGHHQPDRHRHRLGARPAAVATLLAVLVAAGHVLRGRPRTQFAETAGLLVVGVGGALLYGCCCPPAPRSCWPNLSFAGCCASTAQFRSPAERCSPTPKYAVYRWRQGNEWWGSLS